MTQKICNARFPREDTLENPMSCRCSKTNSSAFHFLHHKFTVSQFFLAIERRGAGRDRLCRVHRRSTGKPALWHVGRRDRPAGGDASRVFVYRGLFRLVGVRLVLLQPGCLSTGRRSGVWYYFRKNCLLQHGKLKMGKVQHFCFP